MTDLRRSFACIFALVSFTMSSAVAETVSTSVGGRLDLADAGIGFRLNVSAKGWSGCPVVGEPGDDRAFRLLDKPDGEAVMKGRLELTAVDGKAVARWSFDVLKDLELSCFAASVVLPFTTHCRGVVTLDEKRVDLSESFNPEKIALGYKKVTSLTLTSPGKPGFALAFPTPAQVLVQDNRKWSQDYVVRIDAGPNKVKVGESYTLEMTLSAPDGTVALARAPYVVEPNADWVPVRDTTDFVSGSAVDFTALRGTTGPAGAHGRVVRRGAHFEFEKLPGVVQRFYGVNLCFDANYMSADEADALCRRLAGLGYNALRIHHFEGNLCDPKDGTTIRPEKMAELDNLLNGCIAHGIYLTTDLFVSRRVPYRACGIDRNGVVPQQEFKELVLFHKGAYSNYLAFARAFLGHVNPKTGRRWADEPALATLALVNEGNPGNYGYGAFLAKSPEAQRIWKKWLARQKAREAGRYADIGEELPRNMANSRQHAAFALFLSDVETHFARQMKKFLREEVKTSVLVSDMSCWHNPLAYQLTRREYDYVDDHFYVDHPEWLGKGWQLPSFCPNANPVRGRNLGFEKIVNHRLLDRPFTVSEFNYSGPGQYRGVGGILLGAQAALQEYDGIWRFAWSHRHESLLDSAPMTYFDVARDPLQRLTERAVVALYLRGDLKPLRRTSAFVLPPAKLRADLDNGPMKNFSELWYGWYARLGTVVGDGVGVAADWKDEFPGLYTCEPSVFRDRVAGSRPGDGQVVVDHARGLFGVATPRTCGLFVEAGAAEAGALRTTVSGAPAAVWVSALDAQEIAQSSRLLLSHVTDVQDAGTTYANEIKRVLTGWGKLPHLMHVGTAEISLAVAGKGYKVYALALDGTRRAEVPARLVNGRLAFAADIARDRNEATCLYEIVR